MNWNLVSDSDKISPPPSGGKSKELPVPRGQVQEDQCHVQGQDERAAGVQPKGEEMEDEQVIMGAVLLFDWLAVRDEFAPSVQRQENSSWSAQGRGGGGRESNKIECKKDLVWFWKALFIGCRRA